MNYALSVHWNDYFRFTVENKYMKAGEEWITCYILNPEKGNRLTYQLQVIVIPGFGDASCTENENVITQIRQLFVEMSEKCDPCIAAICLVVEATGGVRLTDQQRYTLQLILSLFGKDFQTNICTFLVSADNKHPIDLTALEESKLPLGNIFYLNQFHHFSRCMAHPSAVLLKKYWSVLVTTISEFFAFVENVAPCTLQLTLTILNERISVMEVNRKLQNEIESVSTQVQRLQGDVRQKQKYEHEMKQNENFEVEVMKMRVDTERLPAGRKDVTSCLTCSYTCHDDCCVPENKKECSAMGENGFCKECPNKCHWSRHTNTPFVFKYVEVKTKKINYQMQMRYSTAQSRFSSQKAAVDASKKCLRSDLNRLNAKITDFKRTIQTKNENALQQDPQSEFIDTADRYRSSNWTGSNTQTLKKFEEIKKMSEDVCDEKEFGENLIRFLDRTTDDTMKESACSLS
ncbi:uncharacterized protein LOC128551398 [Mercenaria mercenaria]|uniref:uncharacterized protein LOC128551398 n=1 Tax=Mercenaria mercenaria TaxID=6596 RepID=UPI00234FB442|nr:uncharacterized protein LOC128551398 [Mercenaria mercenaria]